MDRVEVIGINIASLGYITLTWTGIHTVEDLVLFLVKVAVGAGVCALNYYKFLDMRDARREKTNGKAKKKDDEDAD